MNFERSAKGKLSYQPSEEKVDKYYTAYRSINIYLIPVLRASLVVSVAQGYFESTSSRLRSIKLQRRRRATNCDYVGGADEFAGEKTQDW